jgi:hypothetical protein
MKEVEISEIGFSSMSCNSIQRERGKYKDWETELRTFMPGSWQQIEREMWRMGSFRPGFVFTINSSMQTNDGLNTLWSSV